MKAIFKSLTSLLSVSTLLIGLLTAIPIVISSPAANAVVGTCSDSGYRAASPSDGVTITPSHGRVMYIDTGVTPRLDAAYVGYRITNHSTTTALSGYWVSLTNFRGGVISLANSADANQQLIDNSSPVPDIAPLATKTVYFLLRANTSTKSLQTHTVSVYAGRPDAANATAYSQCDFSFSKVAETIKAAANKVTAVTVDAATPNIGSLVTVTVKGATGTIGAGSADVGKILWFSPAAFSSFPTTSLRLESVKLKVADNNQIAANGSNKVWIYDERLLVTPSITPSTDADFDGEQTTADTLGSKRYYENVYKFRVISRAATSTTINPVAQISSGTQIKHTDVSGSSSGTINTTAAPITLSVSKSASIPNSVVTETVGNVTYSQINYTVTVSNSSGTGRVDQIVDTPGAGVLFKAGTAKIGTTTIPDPIKLSTESSMNPQPLHFVGPFTVASGTNLSLTYTMLVPTTNSATFTNNAVAYTGSQIIGASSSTISGASVTNDGSGVPTSATTTTTNLNPVAVTFNATSIGTTSATLNGTIDGNGQDPTYQFEWATNSSLTGYTTITPSPNSVSGSDPTAFTRSFTGTSGTTYWYRIVAIKNTTRYEGDIVSFTLIEPASASTATTVNASSIAATAATLNGTIDPNLQSITEVRFLYGTSNTLSGATSKILYELNEDGGETTTKVALSGANPIDVALSLTSLATSTTYYFRVEATYTSGTVQNIQGSILSFRTGTTGQVITFSSPSDVAFSGASRTLTASSDSGLAVTFTSETTAVCTVNSSTGVVTYVTAGTCIITASQSGNEQYAPAESVTRQFEITVSAPTAQTNSATSIARTTATFNGAITTGGSSTTVTFTYSTSSSLSSGNTTVTASQSPLTANGSVTYAITGLTAATTYYYRVNATNSDSSVSGSIVSFTTNDNNSVSQTITFADPQDRAFSATPFTETATATSGLTVTLSSSTTSVCTVEAGTLNITMLKAGDCTLTATQGGGSSGGTTYDAATPVTQTFIISKLDQLITFNNLNNMTVGDSNQSLVSSTNASGLSVSLSVDPSSNGICEIISGQVRALTAGLCVLNSNQAGSDIYNPATQVQRSFTITAAPSNSTPSPTPIPTPAPVYVPKPPTITKISAPDVCAVGSQLVVSGTNLFGAKVTIQSQAALVISSTNTQITISLPTQPVGIKTLTVTNDDGSATATVEYKFIDSPIYVDYIYPSTYQNFAFSYTFKATNTEKYSIEGVMPAGLTLNPLTGEVSGTPTKPGDYLFTIVASNFCDQTYLDVYMFVDKAIPDTFTCLVPFLTPRSDTVSEFRLSQLRKCLEVIYKVTPATISPVIFISGGLPAGLTVEESLTHPRYLPILDLIVSMKLNAQIYLGAFNGSSTEVQLNVYWPQP